MNVALHPPDVVVVHSHHHAILQLPVLLCPRVQLNLPVKGADLLDLGRDQITFNVVLSDVQLVLLDTASLDTTW